MLPRVGGLGPAARGSSVGRAGRVAIDGERERVGPGPGPGGSACADAPPAAGPTDTRSRPPEGFARAERHVLIAMRRGAGYESDRVDLNKVRKRYSGGDRTLAPARRVNGRGVRARGRDGRGAGGCEQLSRPRIRRSM